LLSSRTNITTLLNNIGTPPQESCISLLTGKLIFSLSLISPFPFYTALEGFFFLKNMKYCTRLTKLISTCRNDRLAFKIITTLGTVSRLALFSLAQPPTYKSPIIIKKSQPKTQLTALNPQLTTHLLLPTYAPLS